MTKLAELKKEHRRKVDSGTSTEITLSLPPDTHLGVPANPDRWERRNGRVVATYTRTELAWAVVLELSRQLSELDNRLERGKQLLKEVDESEAEALHQHWDALDAERKRLALLQDEIMVNDLGTRWISLGIVPNVERI
jgi:hypothetical protein